jgi:hypothetical protein
MRGHVTIYRCQKRIGAIGILNEGHRLAFANNNHLKRDCSRPDHRPFLTSKGWLTAGVPPGASPYAGYCSFFVGVRRATISMAGTGGVRGVTGRGAGAGPGSFGTGGGPISYGDGPQFTLVASGGELKP